jgi:hypothetical protein
MRKHKERIIRHLTDTDGKRIVEVPLGQNGKRVAVLYEQEFEELIGLGLSPRWRILKDRNNAMRVTVWLGSIKQQISVARLICGADVHQNVSYLDGNPFNLRSTNLLLGMGRGTRNDRTLIKPAKNSSMVFKHEYINGAPQ